MRSGWIAAVLVVAGCSGGVVAPPAAVSPTVPGAGAVAGAGVGRDARIAAECRMLERAHSALIGARGTAPPDIVTGCPGHEGLRDAMPLAQQTRALRAANAAALPDEVRAGGRGAERIYRRMITRGVPEDLARDIARGPEFATAAALQPR